MDELIRKKDAIDAVNRALDRETLLNRLVRRVAIDAIRIVPPVQSDVPDIYAGELISREAAMERLMAQNVIIDGSEYHNGFNAGVNRAQEVIKNLPPVQPKHGRWIERNPLNSDKCRLIECDQCGKSYIVGFNVPYEHWIENKNYCEKCGADMRGGVDG